MLVAQRMSYGPSVDVAHHKMLSGLSRQQVSMRQTMLAQEILGKKKPPISRGLNSYGMNLLADFEAFFFQEAYKQVINRAFIVQVTYLNFLG